jgi:acetyltransferase
MTIRNLDAIFRARSIALIGASARPNSVGLVTGANLLAAGFSGPIMFVNPKHSEIEGQRCYPDIRSLPVVPDLAVICTPPETIPGLISELAQRGTRGAIVITAGFRELGNERGALLERAMLEAGRPHLMRVIGPNCVGVVSTPINLNASFAPGNAIRGGIAFVAQSGAMVTTVLDWASGRGIGFSHLVSLGDMADVDFGDMLDYLAGDPDTKAILLYIEAVTSARKFMSAARAASRLKPVIAIKAGRHEAAAKAAASHTGALAGIDAVYDAAFRRAGILRVQGLDELFDAVETVAAPLDFSGEGLTVLTNGGGVGVLATDGLIDRGGALTPLSPETLAKLDNVLPRTWSRSNPVDIIGDATGKRYGDALSVLLDAPETNAVLVINCPTATASGVDAARAVIETVARKHRCVLTNWLGSGSASEARRLFAAARIPTFETPDDAITGFMHVVRYRRGQDIIMEVPPSTAMEFTPDVAAARLIVEAALARGQEWLSQTAVHDLLSCYGIPAPRLKQVASPAEAASAARELAVPVALKIESPDIVHKSDVGGVALNLDGAESVRQAAEAMAERLQRSVPEARLAGFVVQEMIRKPRAHELIVGMAVDRQFGPFVLSGQGGTAVEVINDKALALPPLNLTLARELMSQTRVFRQLKGYRDRPAAALDDIATVIARVSQLAADLDEVAELDINPLLADEHGVIALDARIRLASWESREPTARRSRLAILPYPRELERTESVPGFATAMLRPIRPEDASALENLTSKVTAEDARLSFFASVRSLGPRQLARMTQIDYDREMVFVLMGSIPGAASELLAVVHLAGDPDNERAEFAILVRSDLQRRGIGRLLMTRLIDYARARGLAEIFGYVLRDNVAMLGLCQAVGLSLETVHDAPETVLVRLRLNLH